MKCLTDSEIQAIVDKEAGPSALAHSASCARCGERVAEYQRRAESIERTLGGVAPLTGGVADRVQRAILTGRAGQGATRLRDARSADPTWRRAGWSTAVGAAAAVVFFAFVLPALRGPQTLSAAAILEKSVSTLAAAPDGVEIREYELILDGMPRELMPDYANGSYRIRQAIDHRTKGRFRFASYTSDGRLLTSIAQDAARGTRVSLMRVDDRYFRFEFAMPPSAIPSLPEIERLHMETTVAMMQASGQQLLQTLTTAEGTFYQIEVPQVHTTNVNAVWDLTHARVLVDAANYGIREFSASGTFLKQPYTVSYKLLNRLVAATVPDDTFVIPPQAGEIVISGPGSTNPVADALFGALREIANARTAR